MKERTKVLLVDDKIENLISLEKILGDFDVEFVRALSGNNALTQTLKHDFAIAIIDVQMPDMDGYETVKIMRDVKRTRLLPVIFVSAIYSENYHVVKGIETGAVDFISKPIIPDILIGKVKVFLDLYEQRVELSNLIHKLEEANSELTLAKEKAERATKAKSMFLASMSHEIRTPLNGVMGMTDIMMQTKLDNQQKEFLSIIRTSGDNLLSIINDILDFSKIEAGQVQMENINFSLHSEVSNIIKMLSYKSIEKGIELDYAIEENVPIHVKGDPLRLKQILLNLLNNAIKFTPAGKVELKISLQKITNDYVKLKFNVVDTGIGISPKGIAKLFKEYSQTERSTSRRYGGTGLGLAISKSLTEMMQGEIGVISEVGKGSDFWFTAKMKKGREPQLQKEDDGSMESGKKLNVLLAEDNPINQKVAAFTLKKFGFNYEIAENGKEAVKLFRDKDFDLILMDILMPEMDGLEATRQIRELEKQEQADNPITIIGLSANAMKEDKQQAFEAGMNNYLSKPFKLSELQKLLLNND